MAREGKNDFGKTGYGGPCPPRGHGAHRYFFTLSALDIASLGLPAGASRQQVDAKMRGHVIASARVMGKYERK
jgi:Raf kinase inhibitor-like YbhB/YbcL family protein